MAPGQRIDGKQGREQAIDLLVMMVDRVQDGLDHLQKTVREDFASQGELENVKLAVQHLRGEVERLRADMTKGFDAKADATARLSDTERKMVKWFLWVGIPGGALAAARFAWDFILKPILNGGGPKP